ncbi:MAG TPA: DUF2804 domain-containing protein [Burkholderiaceae bacterium]
MHSSALPKAPTFVVGADGVPLMGKYAGQTGTIDWRQLAQPYARGRLWRHFHHKRWQYVALCTEQVFCAVAVVELGWVNTAFAYVFDRAAGRIVSAFSQNGIPGLTARVSHRPVARTASHFAFAGKRIEYYQVPGTMTSRLTVRSADLSVDAELDARHAAPFLLAVGPVARGAVHATQKSGALGLSGAVTAGGQTFDLAGGVGSIDYSNGLLARETAWRWASAHTPRLGFNLQAGYFGQAENALWVDGKLYPLGAAQFDFTRGDSAAAWHIHTDDGLLDLHFQPQGERREDKDLLVAASRYVQPLGVFNGWVRTGASAMPIAVDNLFGVTEDHYSRW